MADDTISGSFPILQYARELVDLIIFHVESPSDLLHIALTCRALCRLIIPLHLEFREISCSPISKSVWKYLSESPYKARMVRSVTLLCSASAAHCAQGKKSGPHTEPYSVPAWLWHNDEGNPVDEEIMHFYDEDPTDNAAAMALWEKKKKSWSALCCAVQEMMFLEELTWFQDDKLHEDIVFRFISTLRNSCSQLKRVTAKYYDSTSFEPLISLNTTVPPHELTLNHLRIWTYLPATLTHLTMGLSISSSPTTVTVRTGTLASALQLIGESYPNLRSLAFSFSLNFTSELQPEFVYALFKNAQWPKLESLMWDIGADHNFVLNGDADPDLTCKFICESFFRRHPLISSLTSPVIPPSTALLGASTNVLLPNLKALHTGGTLSQAFEVSAFAGPNRQLGSDTPHSLVFLSCTISSGCVAVLQGLPNLRFFVTRLDHRHEGGNDTLRTMLGVLGAMTKLERLDIVDEWPWRSNSERPPQEVHAFVEPKWSPYGFLHPLLPRLTHLTWKHFITDLTISDLMTPVALYPPRNEDKDVPVAAPMTSLVKMMPNIEYLNVNHGWVRVSQSSPSDRGEIRISFEDVENSGEITPSSGWASLV